MIGWPWGWKGRLAGTHLRALQCFPADPCKKKSRPKDFLNHSLRLIPRFVFFGDKSEGATPSFAAVHQVMQKAQRLTPQVRMCENITYARVFSMG
jgi:hypothetical protein